MSQCDQEPDFLETWTPYRLGRPATFDGLERSELAPQDDRGELVRFAEMYAVSAIEKPGQLVHGGGVHQ